MSDNTTWGIHMGVHIDSDPFDNNYVAIGCCVMSDISQLPWNRQPIKEILASAHPDAKQGAF